MNILAWVVSAALLVSSGAMAADGVLEINASCVSTGCFPGDAPGFPVTIGSSGSYLLTSDLRSNAIVGQGQNFDFIEITASNVSLNLGGFTLSCRTPTIPSAPCATDPVGGGHGISISNFEDRNVSVRNGTIRDMAGDGVVLGTEAILEGVRSLGNGGTGITTGQGSLVRGCITHENAADGVFANRGSVVTNNASSRNGNDGFVVLPASTVTQNTADLNGGDGFDLGSPFIPDFLAGGLASRNTATNNSGSGLNMDPLWGYESNVLTSNNGGNANPQASSGINLGQNVCGSNTTCP